jgi:hypothetical protein
MQAGGIDMTESERNLKRLLANGPLTAVPKRPADQQLLMDLAVAQFEPGRTYSEAEVNETLKAWIDTFCEPYGIDHVTFRRMLVDARMIARTKSGSTYHVNRASIPDVPAAMAPAAMLAEIRNERESRKRQRAS